MTPTRAPFLRPQADAFTERVMACLDEGALAILISIGHRTGLFDGLGSVDRLTAAELAQRAGLDVRYVGHWLEAVHAGGIVDHDPVSGRYSMPPEHAACLSREGGRRNLAVAAQWVAGMGAFESAAMEYFVKGGSGELPDRADEVAEEERQLIARSRIPRVLRRTPGVFNQLERGIDVLDLDSGRGEMVENLAKQFPRSRFHGRDLQGLGVGRACAPDRSADNWTLVPGCILDEGEFVRRFDLILWLRASPKGANTRQVLEWCHRALRRRGRVVVVDRIHPEDREPSGERPSGAFQRALACLQLLPGACVGSAGPDPHVLRKRDEVTAVCMTLGYSSVDVVRTDDHLYSTYVIQR